MAFENLSEQLKESFESIKSRITESESFNRLSEVYDNLPPRQQRLILVIGSLLTFLILINIPIQSFLTSQEELNVYKEQKNTIQKLVVAEQLKNQSDFQPERLDLSRLQSDLLLKMQSLQISESQFKLVPANPDLLGIPRQAVTSGFTLQMNNLNVRQIAKVSAILENYNDSLLVTGFKSVASSDDPHYFNTEFKLLNFSVENSNEDLEPEVRGR